MWDMNVPWWEFVLRGVVVYVFLLVFLRLTGKRQTGQYAPFDLVLLLILSNAVQNSMNAGDNSLVGGLVSAATLIGCHVVLAQLTFHFLGEARAGHTAEAQRLLEALRTELLPPHGQACAQFLTLVPKAPGAWPSLAVCTCDYALALAWSGRPEAAREAFAGVYPPCRATTPSPNGWPCWSANCA